MFRPRRRTPSTRTVLTFYPGLDGAAGAFLKSAFRLAPFARRPPDGVVSPFVFRTFEVLQLDLSKPSSPPLKNQSFLPRLFSPRASQIP